MDFFILTWIVLSLNSIVKEQLTISLYASVWQETIQKEKKQLLGHICVADKIACLVPEMDNPRCSSFRAPPRSKTWYWTSQSFGWTRESSFLMPWLQVAVNGFHIVWVYLNPHSSLSFEAAASAVSQMSRVRKACQESIPNALATWTILGWVRGVTYVGKWGEAVLRRRGPKDFLGRFHN